MISAQSTRRQQSQHHQWLHHQRVRNDSVASTTAYITSGERDDAIAEGRQKSNSAPQQTDRRWSSLQQQNNQKAKMRMNAIKFTTRDGKQMETTSEDTEEINNERVLLEPITHDTEGLDPQHVSQGMEKEAQQVKDQSVFTEIDGNTMTPERKQTSSKMAKHNEYEHEQ